MKTTSSILALASFLAGLCLVATRRASAQEVTNLNRQHSLGLEAGLDSAVVTRATYMHRVDLGFLEDSRIYARFTLPVASPDLADFAFDAGLRARLFGGAGWGVQLLLGPFVRNTENPLFTATALGARALLLPGYQSDRWGLMAELGVEQTLTTRLSHSQLYRRASYSDAKSGWYAITGRVLHAGLRGGARLGSVELSMSAGVAVDEGMQAQMPPFYATLGTAYVF